MYKTTDSSQSNFLNFNQPLGLSMDPQNRWIKMADSIPWSQFEARYAQLFQGTNGNVAKPLRLALGSLIIQTKYQFADRELVEQLTENPYYQYFIGLPGYQQEAPVDASTLVLFRKRLTMDIIMEANEYILQAERKRKDESKSKDDPNQKPPCSGGGNAEASPAEPAENQGTLMLDATCAPSNIRYPQDISLLNEAREKLEAIIIRYCKAYGLARPRMYRRQARKNYLALAKSRKRSKQLLTIYKVYEQQDYMYQQKVHSVADRIVSISQPWLRPIVRGKVKAPVEFGAKFDLSIDEDGYGRIETISFDAYNESTILQDAVERYKERTGRYPERVLADQIYRTRGNRKYCKKYGIRLSGPKLGRPGETAKQDKKVEYQDNTDRIEVERAFSLSKRCYGMGLIRTKLEETTLTSIALSVFVTNLFKIQKRILFALFYFLTMESGEITGFA